jgi:hypothetical protein
MSMALPAPERYGEPDFTTWKKWIRSIRNFILASGITDDARKKATLLHFAGSKVNDVFDTLAKVDGTDTFEETVKLITDHLEPKQNLVFNRFTFRSMKQKEGESVKSYIIRLKEEAQQCAFDAYSINEAIIDQVVVNCKSDKLRKKLLEKGAGRKLTMEEVVTTASVVEETNKQMEELSQNSSNLFPKEEEEEYAVSECTNELNFLGIGSPPTPGRGRSRYNPNRYNSNRYTSPVDSYSRSHPSLFTNQENPAQQKGKYATHAKSLTTLAQFAAPQTRSWMYVTRDKVEKIPEGLHPADKELILQAQVTIP